jgi:hypothetical protein
MYRSASNARVRGSYLVRGSAVFDIVRHRPRDVSEYAHMQMMEEAQTTRGQAYLAYIPHACSREAFFEGLLLVRSQYYKDACQPLIVKPASMASCRVPQEITRVHDSTWSCRSVCCGKTDCKRTDRCAEAELCKLSGIITSWPIYNGSSV